MLRFIISPDGRTINLGNIEAIKVITPPHNKKAMQSFMGEINFVRRFISYFAEIVKSLQDMIKKDVNFKWTKERKEAFDNIKEAVVEAPTLRSSYYTLLPLITRSRLSSHKRMKLEKNFQYLL